MKIEEKLSEEGKAIIGHSHLDEFKEFVRETHDEETIHLLELRRYIYLYTMQRTPDHELELGKQIYEKKTRQLIREMNSKKLVESPLAN